MFQFLNWRKEKGQWIPVERVKGEEEDGKKTESNV
jgi:hypothetical protein